jgi:two-component system NtrC family sensor kinase
MDETKKSFFNYKIHSFYHFNPIGLLCNFFLSYLLPFKTKIILTQIDALGGYVKEELRPAIFKLLEETGQKDRFIIKGLSTTHVRHSVMNRFNNKFSSYTYKRVSTEPINPNHKADGVYLNLIHFFMNNNGKEWRGSLKVDNEEILIMAKPVIVENGCLVCHGKIKDAPQALLSTF